MPVAVEAGPARLSRGHDHTQREAERDGQAVGMDSIPRPSGSEKSVGLTAAAERARGHGAG